MYGTLTRSVADAALLLDVLSGRRPGQEGSLLRAAGREPRRLRIGVSVRPPFNGYRPRLDPEVRGGVRHVAQALAALGHRVVAAEPRYGLIALNFLPRSTAGLSSVGARVPDPAPLDSAGGARAPARTPPAGLIRSPASQASRAEVRPPRLPPI